jgi:hypothetical protein
MIDTVKSICKNCGNAIIKYRTAKFWVHLGLHTPMKPDMTICGRSEPERFILIEDEPEFPIDDETCWYWDTHRPAESKTDRLPFVAVQCYPDKNPNDEE